MRLLSLPPSQQDTLLNLLDIRQNYAAFVRFAWPIFSPGRPLVWNWHIDLICDAVQKQFEWSEAVNIVQQLTAKGVPESDARIVKERATIDLLKPYRRLAIFIPPGDLKSALISVLRPCWIWLRRPQRQSLYFSHSKDLARLLSQRARRILESDAYQHLVSVFADNHVLDSIPWTFEADRNEKHNYANTAGGHRTCFGFDQGFTGNRGDDIVIDDPVDAKAALTMNEAEIKSAFAYANDIIANQMQSRVNDMKSSTWTLMMQRLGEGDPGDVAINDGDWTIICLPKEYNPHHPLRHPADPRSIPGELLNLNFDDRAELARLKSTMTPRHWNAQYGQLTGSASGGLFPRAVFTNAPRYLDDPHALARSLDDIHISVDCSFKKTADSDRVSMLVRGRRGYGRRYLLARVSKRMTFTETMDELLKLNREWNPSCIIVEDKANGPAVLDALTDAIPSLIPFSPGKSSKTERVQAGSAPLYAAHQQVLPDPSIAPWIADFEQQHVDFTGGSQSTPDDDIDAESQSDLYWNNLARQSPWLDLPPAPTPPAPAWAHRLGYARHYIFSPASLIAEPTSFTVGIVPPHPAGIHSGCAVFLSSQGDIVGHAIAPDPNALATAIADQARSIAASVYPGSRKPLAHFRCRVVSLSKTDRHPADRMLSVLAQRDLPALHDDNHPSWWPTPSALAEAAERARDMLATAHLAILDPLVHRTVTRAGLHPETGVPEVPRTMDTLKTYVGRPLAIDGILLATLAALFVVGEARDVEANRAAREGSKPLTYKDQVLANLRWRYGTRDVRVNEASGGPWSGLVRKE